VLGAMVRGDGHMVRRSERYLRRTFARSHSTAAPSHFRTFDPSHRTKHF